MIKRMMFVLALGLFTLVYATDKSVTRTWVVDTLDTMVTEVIDTLYSEAMFVEGREGFRVHFQYSLDSLYICSLAVFLQTSMDGSSDWRTISTAVYAKTKAAASDSLIYTSVFFDRDSVVAGPWVRALFEFREGFTDADEVVGNEYEQEFTAWIITTP